MAKLRKKKRRPYFDRERYREDVDALFADFWSWVRAIPQTLRDMREKLKDLPGTNYRLGERYFEQGDFANALIRFRLTVWIAPTYPEAHFKLGRCFQLLGTPHLAIKHYQLALKYKPDFVEASFMLSTLQKGNRAPAQRLPISLILEHFNRLAPVYRQLYVDRTGYTGHMAMEKSVSDWVSEMVLRGNDRIMQRYEMIELGCGCGITGERLRRYARVMTGIDVSRRMMDHIPEPPEGVMPLYDKLVEEDFHTYLARQPSATADVVFSSGVFNYVGDLREAIGLAANMLRPGGLLAFSVERLLPPEPAAQQGDQPQAPMPYAWQPERGTFSHHLAYLQELARLNGLKPYRVDDIMLYAAVPGYLCMFVRPEAAPAAP